VQVVIGTKRSKVILPNAVSLSARNSRKIFPTLAVSLLRNSPCQVPTSRRMSGGSHSSLTGDGGLTGLQAARQPSIRPRIRGPRVTSGIGCMTGMCREGTEPTVKE
jgi:hypothetical protein